MESFNVMALDKNYEIVALLRYTNLQWNRKYFEPGTFSIQIPASQYLSTMKYIYTKDRPEMGIITQRNYANKNGYAYMQLSGYFLEKLLDNRIVYQNGKTNIQNPPEWVYQSGKAEDVAYAFFNAFKTLTVDGVTAVLDINGGASLGRGKSSQHTRNGEKLGWKINDILKPSGMSYRVQYDFLNSKKQFEVWIGVDRTQENTENNNTIIFSTKYRNIKNPDILFDESSYKNSCITTNEKYYESASEYTVRASLSRLEEDDDYQFLYTETTLNDADYEDEDSFVAAVENEGANALNDSVRTINAEFDAIPGGYEYRKDFDLGDLCSMEIPDIDFSASVRLIGCYEVIKSGEWALTMEFGTPILNRR